MTIPTKPLREILAQKLSDSVCYAFSYNERKALVDAAMRAIAEYNEPFAKAAENVIDGVPEPVFVLRAQDKTADGYVDDWIFDNSHLSPERHTEAVQLCDAMRAWPKRQLPD